MYLLNFVYRRKRHLHALWNANGNSSPKNNGPLKVMLILNTLLLSPESYGLPENSSPVKAITQIQ